MKQAIFGWARDSGDVNTRIQDMLGKYEGYLYVGGCV